MAKRKTEEPQKVTGGSHTLAKRGLVPVQTTVTPVQKRSYMAAAGLAGLKLRDWINARLDAAAIAELAAKGIKIEELTE